MRNSRPPNRNGRTLSTCFTVSRLCEEVATGVLTTNSYLRKIAFFNAWDKVTGIQREETVESGAAPWTPKKAGRSDRYLADLLVNYRNSIHGYGRGHLSHYLSHTGLIPDSLVYLAVFWWLSAIYRPSDFLRGRWVE